MRLLFLLLLLAGLAHSWIYHFNNDDSKLPSHVMQTYANLAEGCEVSNTKLMDGSKTSGGLVELYVRRDDSRVLVVTIDDTEEMFAKLSSAQCDVLISLSSATSCTSNVFLHTFNSVVMEVSKILRSSNTRSTSFIGRHLGGSIATMLAAYFSSVLQVQHVVTFGSPPATNMSMYTEMSKQMTLMSVESLEDYYPWVVRGDAFGYPDRMRYIAEGSRHRYMTQEEGSSMMRDMNTIRMYNETLREVYHDSSLVRYSSCNKA